VFSARVDPVAARADDGRESILLLDGEPQKRLRAMLDRRCARASSRRRRPT
jgi:hypothetical protein